MVASLIVETVASIPDTQRTKPVAILCTDTRVEIPAIAETIETTLDRIRRFSQQNNLRIEVQILKPPPELYLKTLRDFARKTAGESPSP